MRFIMRYDAARQCRRFVVQNHEPPTVVEVFDGRTGELTERILSMLSEEPHRYYRQDGVRVFETDAAAIYLMRLAALHGIAEPPTPTPRVVEEYADPWPTRWGNWDKS